MVVAVSTYCPGATEWTTVNYQNQQPFFSSKWDKIVFCKDVFYCLSFDGGIGVYNPEKSTWLVHSSPPPRVPENLYVDHWWRCKLMAEHNGDIFVIHTSDENPIIYKLEQTNDMWVETEILGGTTLFAHYLCSHARTNLVDIILKSRDMIGVKTILSGAFGLKPRKTFPLFLAVTMPGSNDEEDSKKKVAMVMVIIMIVLDF
ncbi:hypothetical protein BUALT_Bualt11G0096600 [Buddleja alternifolia]|uniref:KIB1-4 beta-propeller domain-containing protein n=1 Tax=Buddleja alternifolia TaxID=168488 RepID=A0AAV6X4N5_9LAMI|nr:hypothetical protein BUALT_Bualt11G0096600 [Buddleja alternifolia]